MRNIYIVLLITLSALFSAQNTNTNEFLEKINQLKVATDYQELSKLEKDIVKMRISRKQHTWHPYYYAAYANIQKGKWNLENGQKDFVVNNINLSIKYLMSIYSKNENNVELNTLLGISYFLKSNFDSQNNNDFRNKAVVYFNKAKGIAPHNERVLLLGNLLNGTSYDLVEDTAKSLLSPSWGKEELGKLIKN